MAQPYDEDPDQATDQATDEGWVHHEPGNGEGFTGWLYHYGAVVVASIATVLSLFLVAPDPNAVGLVPAICLGTLAAGAAGALANWRPTVVTIHERILQVSSGQSEEQYHLSDPNTRVELGKQPSPSWRATAASDPPS